MSKKTPRKHTFALSDANNGITIMFEKKGWQLVSNPHKADVVVFPGGADICPLLYGQKKLPKTNFDMFRDIREVRLYRDLPRSTPKIGICRGAQFLNVMCGGSLYQDVNNHGSSHLMTDLPSGEKVMVTSTHHQMMIPGSHGLVLATAALSTQRHADDGTYICKDGGTFDDDTEAVFYDDENCLCFQPHPGYYMVSCGEYFDDLVDTYISGLIPLKP